MRCEIISVFDRDGNEKREVYNAIKNTYNTMTGTVLYPKAIKVGDNFCLLFENDSDKVFETSSIISFKYADDKLKIETNGSIYIMKILNDECKLY